jgi:RNase H-fold protein (predicted Holliday junction resolvase)
MAATILGISLGTRVIGIGVMRDGELMYNRVRTFRSRWSKDKEKAIHGFITRLIEYYSVNYVALKTPDPIKSSNRLDDLSEILKQVIQKKIDLYSYSLPTVNLGLAIKSRNKNAFMEQIAERYPELRKIYLKEVNNRHSYYERMFEAIAIAKWCEMENKL